MGRDGVHARCLPDSLIHQLSPGRSQQETEDGGGVRRKKEKQVLGTIEKKRKERGRSNVQS